MSVNSQMATGILKGILGYYRFPDNMFIGSQDRVQEMKAALQAAGRAP